MNNDITHLIAASAIHEAAATAAIAAHRKLIYASTMPQDLKTVIAANTALDAALLPGRKHSITVELAKLDAERDALYDAQKLRRKAWAAQGPLVEGTPEANAAEDEYTAHNTAWQENQREGSILERELKALTA